MVVFKLKLQPNQHWPKPHLLLRKILQNSPSAGVPDPYSPQATVKIWFSDIRQINELNVYNHFDLTFNGVLTTFGNCFLKTV